MRAHVWLYMLSSIARVYRFAFPSRATPNTWKWRVICIIDIRLRRKTWQRSQWWKDGKELWKRFGIKKAPVVRILKFYLLEWKYFPDLWQVFRVLFYVILCDVVSGHWIAGVQHFIPAFIALVSSCDATSYNFHGPHPFSLAANVVALRQAPDVSLQGLEDFNWACDLCTKSLRWRTGRWGNSTREEFLPAVSWS